MLLAAAVVVVVAMRPSDDVPLPAPPSLEEPGTAYAAPPPSAIPPPLVPSALTHADVPIVAPAATGPEVEPAPEVDPVGEGDPSADSVVVPAHRGAPVVPPAASALQGVHMAVPIAQVLAPGAPVTPPPVAEQRLDAMESLVAGQEAQLRQLEGTLAEAERTGDVDGARLRRDRLATLRRVHGTLRTQLERMRAERAAASPN